MEIKELFNLFGKKTSQNGRIKKFKIDSRQIEKGDFFVPIKGSRYDGHQFIKDAVKKGAVGFFTQRKDPHPASLHVKNTLEALTTVGKHKRRKLSFAVGITGTSGKTTTKELLDFVLSEYFRTYSTPGNLNNEIGHPLTLANIPEGTQAGIFELGAGKIGDISYLVSISKPEIRILTSVGHGHTEKFGSLENVIKGKGEIFEGGDVGILPSGIKSFYKHKNVITFGSDEGSDIRILSANINDKGTEGIIQIGKKSYRVELPVFNMAVFNNLGAVFGVLHYLGIDPEKAVEKLRLFQLPEGRGKVITCKNLTIIDDTYNANPLSVENAVRTLSMIKGKKIIVLGDMLELGKYSIQKHKEVGKIIQNSPIDAAIFYGDQMRYAYEVLAGKKEVYYFTEKKDIADLISSLKEKTTIWIKGSRGMKMEQIIHQIVQD